MKCTRICEPGRHVRACLGRGFCVPEPTAVPWRVPGWLPAGGEKKRNEILQLACLEADMAILDEIDSGALLCLLGRLALRGACAGIYSGLRLGRLGLAWHVMGVTRRGLAWRCLRAAGGRERVQRWACSCHCRCALQCLHLSCSW